MLDIVSNIVESLSKDSPYALTTVLFMVIVFKMYNKSIEKIDKAYKEAMREMRRAYTGKKSK